MKNALDAMPVFTLLAIRFTGGAALMALVCWNKWRTFTRDYLWRGAIIGFVLFLAYSFQLTAVMYGAAALPADTDWTHLCPDSFSEVDLAGKVGYLAEIRNIKFKALVRPGDTLELYAVKKVQMGLLSQVQVFARVNGINVVEGVITVSQKA